MVHEVVWARSPRKPVVAFDATTYDNLTSRRGAQGRRDANDFAGCGDGTDLDRDGRRRQ